MSPDVVVADAPTLAERLRVDFDARGRAALAARGVFTVALSGGSLAPRFFPELARLPFDWSRTEFFWADERAVPPGDPESNYAVADALWLGPAHVPAGNVHRMRAEDPDLELAADDYAVELTQAAGTPPQLDFVLLGVGPDGHVASLFPGHEIALEEQRLVAMVVHSPKPPPRRLTLTMPVLANAGRVVVVALGREKAEAVRDGLDPNGTTPLAALTRRARDVRFLLDREAARLLDRRATGHGPQPVAPKPTS